MTIWMQFLSSFRNDTFPESERRDRNQTNIFKLQCLWVSQNIALSFQRWSGMIYMKLSALYPSGFTTKTCSCKYFLRQPWSKKKTGAWRICLGKSYGQQLCYWELNCSFPIFTFLCCEVFNAVTIGSAQHYSKFKKF